MEFGRVSLCLGKGNYIYWQRACVELMDLMEVVEAQQVCGGRGDVHVTVKTARSISRDPSAYRSIISEEIYEYVINLWTRSYKFAIRPCHNAKTLKINKITKVAVPSSYAKAGILVIRISPGEYEMTIILREYRSKHLNLF